MTVDGRIIARDDTRIRSPANAFRIAKNSAPRDRNCSGTGAYARTKNPAFADKALATLAGGGPRPTGQAYATWRVEPPDVLNSIDEYPFVSTNNTAQSSLNIIEVLELCKDRLN